MSRPALLITATFYTVFGLALLCLPTRHLGVATSTIESVADAMVTQLFLGAFLFLAGVFSFAAYFGYRVKWLRVIAAGLRAGSMGTILLLVILVALFTPSGSTTAVIIFGYLFALSLCTLPPPIEPLDAAIRLLRARQQGENVG